MDSPGNAYVAGKAGAANFPVTAGAAQTTFGGAQGAFARPDPTGRIVYSTFLGGSGSHVGTGIAVDSSGNAYVSGYTVSANFPTSSGVPQQKFQDGYQDAFLAKLNPAGSQFLHATLFRGQGNDTATLVAVDGSGNTVIAGYPDSSTFPVSNAFQAQYGERRWIRSEPESEHQQSSHGGYDAFVVKLNSSGRLVYSTLLGGSGTDNGNAIVVDAAGQAWSAGR